MVPSDPTIQPDDGDEPRGNAGGAGGSSRDDETMGAPAAKAAEWKAALDAVKPPEATTPATGQK